MRSIALLLVTLLMTLASAPTTNGNQPKPVTWTVQDYHGTAQGLARVIHGAFNVNVVLPASDQATLVRLDLKDGTLDDFLDALATQFTPPLSVIHDGAMYKLLPSGSVESKSIVAYLKHASKVEVAKAITQAFPGSAVTANPVPGAVNAITIVGNTNVLATAQRMITALDVEATPQPNASADPSAILLKDCLTGSDGSLPSCFIPLSRLSPKEAIDDLKQQLPEATGSYSTLPEPEQGGFLITASDDVLRSAARVLYALDHQKKRQLQVTVAVYDVIPFNNSKSLGAEYGAGSSTTGSTNSSGSFSPGLFFRPSLLSNISGVSAQINALSTMGSARLVEAPVVKIALDSGADDERSSSNAGQQAAQSNGYSGGIGGAVSIPTVNGVGQTSPGAATIVVGNTNIVPFQSNGLTNSFQVGTINSGITFTVRPMSVSYTGLIKLYVSASFSNITSYQNGLPQLGGKSLDTHAYVQDGESLPFGGLYADTQTSSTTKVPLLGDIPLFGRLFRNDDTTASREQLVFILTPEVESL